MCSRQALDLKRFSASGGQDLLDEKRLEAIRKKIAVGVYNRNDVQRSIVERLAHSLAEECDTCDDGDAADAGDGDR